MSVTNKNSREAPDKSSPPVKGEYPEGGRGCLPGLRFPEFRDAGDWKEKQLGDILSVGNGRDHKHLADGNIPVYGSGGYMRSVNEYLYDGESVCIGRKGTINNPIFLSGKFWTVDTLFYTHSYIDCFPFFAYVIFQNINWLDHNEAGGIPSLSKANIEKIDVAVPTLPEQQKIAECLTSIDDLITAEAQNLDALKTHKNGLMQQLFPCEGEVMPRLRFPEFRDAGDWQTEFGNEVFKQISDKEHDSDRPVLAITQEHGAVPRELIDYHVSVSPKSIAGYKVVKKNDFIISLRSFQGGIEHSNYHGICSPAYVVLRSLKTISIDYFRHYLKNAEFIRLLNVNLAGLRDGKMISYKQFSEIPIPTPREPEQQKIAACLTSIDDLITAKAQKIDALKTHKNGLMQHLFPTSNEVNV